jgi:mono/diheme cytochrome c family protein
MARHFLILGGTLWGLCTAALSNGAPGEPPRRWTLADFGGVLSVGLEGHRDFASGQRLFSNQCARCHKLGELGGGAARDLSRRSLTYTPEELLAHILSPEVHPAKLNGLLDAVSQAGVLDLLAFILSGADSKHSFFFHL